MLFNYSHVIIISLIKVVVVKHVFSRLRDSQRF